MRDCHSFKSKEDLTQRISKSVFVNNFPDQFSARDLWNACNAYGKVVDVYILLKKSKAGKKFAFFCFLKVDNLDRLVDNLCTIWIGRLRLHANPVRYQRETRDSSFKSTKEKISKHVGVASWFNELLPASNSFVSNKRIIWISVQGLPIKTLTRNPFAKIVTPWGKLSEVEVKDDSSLPFKKLCMITRPNVIINNKIKLIVKGKFYWIRVRELDVWTPKLNNDLNEDPFRIYELLNGSKENVVSKGDDPIFPLGFTPDVIEEMVMNNKDGSTTRPNVNLHGSIEGTSSARSGSNHVSKLKPGGSILEVMENLVEVGQTMRYNMDGWLGQSAKKRWIHDLNMKHKVNFVAIQETKMENIDLFSINALWGNYAFEYTFSPSIGYSGGTWTPTSSKSKETWKNSLFVESNNIILLNKKFQALKVAIKQWCKEDKQRSNASKSSIQSRLAYLDMLFDQGKGSEGLVNERSMLLKELQAFNASFLLDITQKAKVRWSIEGDTNSKYFQGIINRKRSQLAIHGVLVEGKFYWIRVRELDVWTPKLNNDLNEDPFRIYELLNGSKEKVVSKGDDPIFPLGFTPDVIEEMVMNNKDGSTTRPNVNLHGSIEGTSSARSGSNHVSKLKPGGSILEVMENLVEVGQTMRYNMDGWLGQSAKKRWIHDLNMKHKVNFVAIQETKMENIDLFSINALWGNYAFEYTFSPSIGYSGGTWTPTSSKSKETWKNSLFVESNNIILLNKKFQALKVAIKQWCKEDKQRSNASKSSIQSRLAYLDMLFDQGKGSEGLVNERSMLLKELQAFNASFLLDITQKAKVRWSIEGDTNSKYFQGIINRKRSQLAIHGVLVEGDWVDEPLTNEDLERTVKYDEIKCVVWDCGSNKSPGPDGFTFEFYRRYWKLIDHDVVNTVFDFFSFGKFPPGFNSLFITLTPKTQDAKVIKDFCPVSLIGSVYKIVTNILANRLSLVILDLISDFQSVFVANRQILDGPFILNELISWCKFKKIKVMIFKVDFEKAFDSVRWDYIDDILNRFGFDVKWRG
nr:RNA-directed DNA polymerase, eukaryota, reverse transcriptase zinc-binding domain protein [Tanacetum cinerariifolium]